MEVRLTREMMEALAEPFAPEAVQWKPGATNRDNSRGLALAYVDSRYYQDRLNSVFGSAWGDTYEVHSMGGKVVVLCQLSLTNVSRSDVGECDLSDPNAVTTAKAQSFKRACAAFGLGAYLYRLPRLRVEYDPQRKRFTDAALAHLERAISSGNGESNGDNGHVLIPAGPHMGKPLSWLVENDRAYLERIATEAQDGSLRQAAQALLN